MNAEVLAFDRASRTLLQEDLTRGVEQNANEVVQEAVARLRVLFRAELDRLEFPRPKARPA